MAHPYVCARFHDSVCVLPDSARGSCTLVLQTLYLVNRNVTNHFWTDIKRLSAAVQLHVTDLIYFKPESSETPSAAEIAELGGCL